MDFIGHHWSRRVSPHAAGVRAGIAVAYAFVILAGGHRQHVLAVDHHDKACLFAVEELLNHDTVARVAKGVACQHVMNGGFGFFQRHRHDNAFTGSQTVSFDDDRRAFLTQISQGWLNLGEILVFRRRNLVTSEEIFGEGFGAFQLGGPFGWAKDLQTRRAERIDHANHQRRFRANDGQVNLLVLGKAQQRRNIGDADSHVLQRGLQRGTGVTRCDKNSINQRRLCGFPGQRVFASAVTNH